MRAIRMSTAGARSFFGTRVGRSKYGNTKTNGFDSKLEARFYEAWLYPRSLAEGFTIEKQKKFEIIVNGVHICNYLADFFVPEQNTIYEVKGMFTDVALLKVRLVQALYGNRIIIVKSLSRFEEVPKYRQKKARLVTP